jgi:hypothetical protein
MGSNDLTYEGNANLYYVQIIFDRSRDLGNVITLAKNWCELVGEFLFLGTANRNFLCLMFVAHIVVSYATAPVRAVAPSESLLN